MEFDQAVEKREPASSRTGGMTVNSLNARLLRSAPVHPWGTDWFFNNLLGVLIGCWWKILNIAGGFFGAGRLWDPDRPGYGWHIFIYILRLKGV